MRPPMMLRILQISPEYPPYHMGGGGVVVQSIAHALLKRGHIVSVIAGYHPTKHGFERTKVILDGPIDVSLLPLFPTPRLPLQLKTVMPPNFFSILLLTKILLKRNFDAIHLHGFGHFLIDFSAFVCRMTGRPYIVTLHGFPHSPLKARRLFRLLYRLYVITVGRRTLVKADHVTVVSAAVSREADSYGISKVRIIPNGVDLDRFNETETSFNIRGSLAIRQDDQLIMAIGILHERKGFQYLIKALALVKRDEERVKLFIIGKDGGYAKKLQELAKAQQVTDRVVFTGYVDSKTKLAIMMEADILVIPSSIEAFGLVALEAMAMGKPIVSTRVGGLASIFKNEKTALLVEPKSPQSLAKAIVRLLRNSDLRIRLSENSKCAVMRFCWNTIIEKYLEIYKPHMHAGGAC